MTRDSVRRLRQPRRVQPRPHGVVLCDRPGFATAGRSTGADSARPLPLRAGSHRPARGLPRASPPARHREGAGLARAQEFVVSGATGGVPLRDLVEAELSAFAARMKVNGIPLVVGSAFGQQFALVIHELATNAAKYGSLSTPKGYVLINWDVNHHPVEPALVFSWAERGGPPVTPPTEEGFGSRLITATLNGKSRVLFGDLGLEFSVEIPLSEIMKASRTN